MTTDLFPTFRLPRGVRRRLQSSPRPSYRQSIRWNFERGDVDVDGSGNIVLASGFEAWAQWGIKATLTERGAPATLRLYGPEYGAEIMAALKLPRQDATAALEVAITRAWLANPQTKSVHSFEFEWVGSDGVEIRFEAEPVVGPVVPQTITLGSF
jgi:hypothetical protein